MPDETKKQVLEIVFRGDKARSDSKAYADFEQKQTKETASVAAKAAKDTAAIAAQAAKQTATAAKEASAAAKKAIKEQAEAAVKGYKDQVSAGTRAAADEAALAAKLAAAKLVAVKDGLKQQTSAFSQALNEQARLENAQHAEARIQTQKLLRDRATEYDATAKKEQAAIEETRRKSSAAMQHITDKMKQQKQATASAANSVMGLANAFMAVQAATTVLNLVKEGMQAVGASTEAARAHVKGLVEEMERARTASREIAALTGNKATAMFTANQAREAGAVGLSPESYQQFEVGFQAYTGQYIGKEGATPEELQTSGQRISADQAKELQGKVAAYSVGARGLTTEDSARLLGTVVAKSKPGASNEAILSEYAKLMKISELAPGRTSTLVGQLSELGMESVGEAGDFKQLQQAAYLIRVMAQRNPQEASTYGRAMLMGLRDIRMDPKKSGELGITKGMDVMGQLAQVDKMVQANTAAGGDQGEFLSKYFPEIRRWGGIQTALNEGIRGGGFKRAELEAATVNAGTAEKEIKGYLGGQEGRAMTGQSRIVAASRERAARQVPLREVERNAMESLISSGQMEVPENMMNAVLTTHGASFGQGSREQQELRALVSANLNRDLSGYKKGREFLSTHRTLDRASTVDQQSEAALMLDRLRKAAEQAATALEKLNAPGGGAGPVAVAPVLAPPLVVPGIAPVLFRQPAPHP